MRKLSPIDMAFLLAERRHQPLHVGALCLFHPPPGAAPDFAVGIAERLRESRHAAPPFNRRLTQRAGLRSWLEADDFDLAQHFVHISLPRPGRIRDLLAMISRVHSAHLDRAYPLWRVYLIEGLEDGRIATYTKIHHSVVDGVAGLRLMLKSMSADLAESAGMAPPWDMGFLGVGQPPAPPPNFLSAGTLGAGVRSSQLIIRHTREFLRDVRAGHPDVVTSVQAPHCMLNQPITGSRRFAAQSYSMPRIRAVAGHFGASSNDIVLGLCAAALRRYLLDHNDLPAAPLIAGVPVSTRRDEGVEGNQVAFALANLGTHLADPVERIRVIQGSMNYHKQKFADMSPTQLLAYSAATLAPGVLTFLPGLHGKRTVANVVISHVPGPRQDVYWQGCQLSGIYPASLVLDGFALNITVVSRHDNIDFGILACRRSLPKIQRLLDYLDDALRELETALGLPGSPPSQIEPEQLWDGPQQAADHADWGSRPSLLADGAESMHEVPPNLK